MTALDTMTWRRFHVLIKCLSPHSATVNRIQSSRMFGQKNGAVNKVVGPKAAQQAFEALAGGAIKPKPAST